MGVGNSRFRRLSQDTSWKGLSVGQADIVVPQPHFLWFTQLLRNPFLCKIDSCSLEKLERYLSLSPAGAFFPSPFQELWFEKPPSWLLSGNVIWLLWPWFSATWSFVSEIEGREFPPGQLGADLFPFCLGSWKMTLCLVPLKMVADLRSF